jgi:hypothetical protein
VPSQQGLRVLRLDDMMRHCRLQTPEQVLASLEAINQALQQASGDPEAVLTVVDNSGHVLVPEVTARGIQAIWQEIVDARRAAAGQSAPASPVAPQAAPAAMPPPIGPTQPFQPYAISVPSPAMGTDPAHR